MAAVVASKTQVPTKMKKPSVPFVQTNINGNKPTAPSSSPSSATKRLPGQAQPPVSAFSNSAAANNTTRPNRRLQRINTRNNASEHVPLDKKGARKAFAEPYGIHCSYALGWPRLTLCLQFPRSLTFSKSSKATHPPSLSICIQHISALRIRMAAFLIILKCAYSSNICRKRLYHMTWLKSFARATCNTMMVG